MCVFAEVYWLSIVWLGVAGVVVGYDGGVGFCAPSHRSSWNLQGLLVHCNVPLTVHLA